MPFHPDLREQAQRLAEQSIIIDPIELDPDYIAAYDAEVAGMMLSHGMSEPEVIAVLGYLPTGVGKTGPDRP